MDVVGLVAREGDGRRADNGPLGFAELQKEDLHQRAVRVVGFVDGEDDGDACGFGDDVARREEREGWYMGSWR